MTFLDPDFHCGSQDLFYVEVSREKIFCRSEKLPKKSQKSGNSLSLELKEAK